MGNKDNTNTYVSASDVIYKKGASLHKQEVSNYFSNEAIEYLNRNILYVHDREFFDVTLNCCAVSLKIYFLTA